MTNHPQKEPYDGSIFPTTVSREEGGNTLTVPANGLSLRDWFAGQVLASYPGNEPLGVSSDAPQVDIDAAMMAFWSSVARAAYIAADAMLAARLLKHEAGVAE